MLLQVVRVFIGVVWGWINISLRVEFMFLKNINKIFQISIFYQRDTYLLMEGKLPKPTKL
jgi:hypothetical protein